MSAKLFVGNLTFTATENDLQDHFAQAGVVVSVNIMQDRMTGRSRGFAFIEMGSKEDAEKAIQMFHSKDFQGRPLTVNEAVLAKSVRPAVAAAAAIGVVVVAAAAATEAIVAAAAAAENVAAAIVSKPQF